MPTNNPYPTLNRTQNPLSLYGMNSPTNPMNATGALGGALGGNLSSSTVSPVGSLPTDYGPQGTIEPDWTTVGNMDSGGGKGALGGYGGLIGNLAPLALSLFAPKDQYNVPGSIRADTAAATKLGAQGEQTFNQGAQALNPVLNYLAKVTSGDPQAIIEATMPERRRVIDQYDTARQQAQFAPRGGGTSSAVINANTREASDLAEIGAKARTAGMTQASQLGQALTASGAQTESASLSHLTSLLSPMLNDKQNTEQEVFKTFASMAMLFAL